MQDLQRRHPLIGQRHRAPLGETGTGGGGAVAEGGEEGVSKALPARIDIENTVHDLLDIGKHRPAVPIGHVVSSGVCDVEVKTAGSVPFGVDPVEREGHNGVDVGIQRAGRPGGIDLAGGHICDIYKTPNRCKGLSCNGFLVLKYALPNTF